MGLRELIELNKIVFGCEVPLVRAFYNSDSKDSSPFWIKRNLMMNQFIYTGCENSILLLECQGDKYAYYFSNYVCFADVYDWLFNVQGRPIGELDYISVLQNRFIAMLSTKPNTTEDDYAAVCSNLRWYLVEYNQTKTMLL